MPAEPLNVPFAVIGRAGDLYPGWRRALTVGRTTVLVCVEEDGIHAIADTCPHYEVALHNGRRRGDYIECPWHNWLIDVRTGECMHNPRIKNRTFDVIQHDGTWFVMGDPSLDAQVEPQTTADASGKLIPTPGDAARTDRTSLEGDQA